MLLHLAIGTTQITQITQNAYIHAYVVGLAVYSVSSNLWNALHCWPLKRLSSKQPYADYNVEYNIADKF